MTWAVTDLGAVAGGGGAVTSITLSGLSVPPGALIYVGFFEFVNSNTQGSLSSTPSLAFHEVTVGNPGNATANGIAGTAWAINNSGSPITSITYNFHATGSQAVLSASSAISSTGLPANPVDLNSPTTSVGTSSSISVFFPSQAQPGELVYAWNAITSTGPGWSQDSGNQWSSVGGLDAIQNSGNQAFSAGGNQVNVSGGNLFFAPTITASVPWFVAIVAFMPAPPPSGVGPVISRISQGGWVWP